MFVTHNKNYLTRKQIFVHRFKFENLIKNKIYINNVKYIF